jgi:hypothetical protein
MTNRQVSTQPFTQYDIGSESCPLQWAVMYFMTLSPGTPNWLTFVLNRNKAKKDAFVVVRVGL